MSKHSAWASPKLAYLYALADAHSEKMESGSTEQGLVREAMSKLELADKYVEQRIRDNAQPSSGPSHD